MIMKHPFKIVRVVKRAITWFFEEETETIGCNSLEDVNANLQKGDKVLKLSNKGIYRDYDKFEYASQILDMTIKHYDESNSIQTPGKWRNHWDEIKAYESILERLSNKWD